MKGVTNEYLKNMSSVYQYTCWGLQLWDKSISNFWIRMDINQPNCSRHFALRGVYTWYVQKNNQLWFVFVWMSMVLWLAFFRLISGLCMTLDGLLFSSMTSSNKFGKCFSPLVDLYAHVFPIILYSPRPSKVLDTFTVWYKLLNKRYTSQ